jgi:ATP-dependent Clp protease ATP-binding subunit ClpC
VTGTSDEQPEQAGRRQMAIEVTDEILTVVLTDPVIVEAGRQALRAVNARAAAAAKSATQEDAGGEGAADEPSGDEAESASATSTVIRGDNLYAAGLADVWLELRKTLNRLADPAAGRRVKIAEGPQETPAPAEPIDPEEPGEPGEAAS